MVGAVLAGKFVVERVIKPCGRRGASPGTAREQNPARQRQHVL